MKGTYLGEFEELVLLVVAIQNGSAYGVSLTEEIEVQSERSVSLSSVHTALYRLEKKGFVSSRMGDSTNSRGGRKKRLYSITASGHAALSEANSLRNKLWGMMPDFGFNFRLG